MPSFPCTRIVTERYITDYFAVSKKTRFLKHVLAEQSAIDHFEIWPNMWMFSYGEIPKDIVQIQVAGKTCPIEGHVGILIPPLSPLTWKLQPRIFESYGVFSLSELPSSLQNKVTVFEFSKNIMPQNEHEVLQLLEWHAGQKKELSKTELPHSTSEEAQALKDALEDNYLANTKMTELASHFTLQGPAFSRKFSRYFDASPLEYRNRMKISLAFEMLLFAERPMKINEVLQETGFDSFSSFNKQFKKFVQAAPSAYLA